jgi:hypothetical protein
VHFATSSEIYSMPVSFINFLHNWQELVGAFGGSSLAVLLSGIGYLIVRKNESIRELKETMRRIEVDSTYGLNSIFTMQEKLSIFTKSARKLITEIRAITDPKEFALQTINFPALGTLYVDDEMPLFRVNSYYLHNKLLWIHAGTQGVNGVISGLKDDFARIIRINENMVQLMNAHPNPPAQRASYLENLEIFTNEIDRFCKEEITKGIMPLVQVKVYNDKLRKPFGEGVWIRWKYEGGPFRHLREKLGFVKIPRDLNNVDRIDAIIQPDVDRVLKEIEERAKKLAGNP